MTDRPVWQEMGLSDAEYQMILEMMGRTPNHLELGMFAVMWSEHCGYKNSRPVLKLFPTAGPQVIQGPGENAGVVDIGDNQALVFKIESHNHPSAIEPYQGAATGVGGIVRDIFTMGARPIALLDSLRFGPLEDERVRHLFAGVVSGIGGYGNCLGIPTVGGEVYFEECYRGNPLVNAMCVGLVDRDDIALAVAGEVGSPLMVVGARTGRDGIHGATFASEELSDESQEKRPSVQVGDPFMEKLLIEACLELIREDLVFGMQDLGAAGLTSSAAEMASKDGRGVEIDVSLVPRREKGMTPYEVMLSESQERMLICPRPGCEQRIREIFDRWGLDATVIGQVTGDGWFRVKEAGVVVGEVPVQALTTQCPVYHRPAEEPPYYRQLQQVEPGTLPPPGDCAEVLRRLLASPNIASKEWVYSQYDHQVMINTVVLPGAGDAALLRVKGTPKAIALTTDCNGRMVYLDPFRGGMMAVCEAARNIACTGARPLALTNCLNFGNPEKPHIFWQFQRAVEGMAAAAARLGTPVVSGNVSFYNETKGEAVYPTPVVGMVGLLEDIETRVGMGFRQAGDVIVLVGGVRGEIGGSEYLARWHGLVAGEVPEVDLDREKALVQLLQVLARRRLISSAHDVADGGLAVALAEAAIVGGLGFSARLDPAGQRPDFVLFSEAPGRAVVSVSPLCLGEVLALAEAHEVEAVALGQVGGDRLELEVGDVSASLQLEEAAAIWKGAIRWAMS